MEDQTCQTNTELEICGKTYPLGTMARIEGVTQGGWRLQVVFLDETQSAIEYTTVNMDVLGLLDEPEVDTKGSFFVSCGI